MEVYPIEIVVNNMRTLYILYNTKTLKYLHVNSKRGSYFFENETDNFNKARLYTTKSAAVLSNKYRKNKYTLLEVTAEIEC